MGRIKTFVQAVAKAYAEGIADSGTQALREDFEMHLMDKEMHFLDDDCIGQEQFDDVVRRLEALEREVSAQNWWKADRNHDHGTSSASDPAEA